MQVKSLSIDSRLVKTVKTKIENKIGQNLRQTF